jgi:hypothetical protein
MKNKFNTNKTTHENTIYAEGDESKIALSQ